MNFRHLAILSGPYSYGRTAQASPSAPLPASMSFSTLKVFKSIAATFFDASQDT